MPHTNQVEQVENQGWDERILVFRNGRLVQTFMVITTHYVVLVDTLINPQTAKVLLDRAQPYLSGGRSLLVINTHADYDHCWGNQLFAGPRAEHPAPIIGHQRTLAVFAGPVSEELLPQMQAQEPEIFQDVRLVPPTVTFSGRCAIHGGDLTLELLETPGHTEDHVAVYLPEINTLLAADGAELPYPVARHAYDLPRMRNSLAQMAALSAETVLYCHAPVTMGPQLLIDNIAYFDHLENSCQTALVRGVTELPDDDTALIALLDCPFSSVVPAGTPWTEVHPYYQTTGHAAQLRAMWSVLAGQSG